MLSLSRFLNIWRDTKSWGDHPCSWECYIYYLPTSTKYHDPKAPFSLSFSRFLSLSLHLRPRLAINQKFPNDVARRWTSPQVFEATTVKVFDLCYRQHEINFVVVVRTYVSQHGFIWKQRCRCSLSFLLSTTSINTVIHGSCRTLEHILEMPCRLNSFYVLTKSLLYRKIHENAVRTSCYILANNCEFIFNETRSFSNAPLVANIFRENMSIKQARIIIFIDISWYTIVLRLRRI